MCRGLDEGGRRCACTPEQLRAQQRAQYAVRVDTLEPVPVDGTPVPADADTALEPLIERARDALSDPDALFVGDDSEWVRPTPRGIEAEERVRAVGAVVAARAEEIAREPLAQVGQHPDLVALRPGGFTSREDYDTWVTDEDGSDEMLRLHREVMSYNPRTKARRLAEERLNEFVESMQPSTDERVRIAKGEGTWDAVEGRAWAQSYRQALEQVRPMGLKESTDLHLSDKSDPEAVEVLRGALGHYPSEWSEAEGSYESRITYSTGRREEGVIPLVVTYGEPEAGQVVAESGHYQAMTRIDRWEKSTEPWTKRVPLGEDLPEDGVVEGQGWATDLREMGVEGEMAFFPWDGEGEPSEEEVVNRKLTKVHLVRTSEEREVYENHYESQIVLSRNSPTDHHATAVHEYGHRMENVRPSINAACQVFLARRTSDEAGSRAPLSAYAASRQEQRLGAPRTPKELVSRNYNEPSCWTREGGFATAYTGLETGSTDASEVFTTGMEGLMSGRYGGLRGGNGHRADHEHRDLTLGLLATC